MIPFSSSVGNNSRVPQIYNTNAYITIPNNISGNDSSNTIPHCSTTSRRGRRSDIPLETRQQTLRIKKQNLERKRRACISDKINALYNLAMNLIGIDSSNNCQRVEKADILSLCHNVLKGIANIVKDEPHLQLRLRKVRDNLNKPSSSSELQSSAASTSVEIKADSVNVKQKIKLDPQEEENSLNHYRQSDDHYQNYNVVSSPSSKVHIPSSFSSSSSPLYSMSNGIHYNYSTDDKENQKIPKLGIGNVWSCINYTPPVITTVTTPLSTIPTSHMNSNTFHLTLTPPLFSSIHSTPLSNAQLNNLMYKSTPIQYTTKVLNSSVVDYSKDSGFDDTNNQSIEMTRSIKEMLTSNDEGISQILLNNSLFKVSSSAMPFSSSLSSTESLSSSSSASENYRSVLPIPELNRPPVFDMMRKLVGGIPSVATTNQTGVCSSIVVTSSNSAVYTNKPPVTRLWRPYLD